MFNISISLGIVPQSLKLANAIPVYKKGPQTNLSDYRPISLLSIFNELLDFLDKNNLAFVLNILLIMLS